MMYLEHINLVVKDLPATLKFYKAAFPHWGVRGGGEQNWYGTIRNWVHFGDDYQYLTFNDSGAGELNERNNNKMGMSHFAFVVSNMDAVMTRLASNGYEVYADGAVNQHRRNVYYLDPNGYEVEFVEYLSDVPSERNTYDV